LYALKLGLSARTVVLPSENAEDFVRLLDALVADLRPIGAREELLVEEIAALRWRLARSDTAEASLIGAAVAHRGLMRLQRHLSPADEEKDRPNSLGSSTSGTMAGHAGAEEIDASPVLREAEVDLLAVRDGKASDLGAVFSDSGGALGLILRYRTATERAFLRTAHELERLQAIRGGKDVQAPIAVDVTVDAARAQSPERIEFARTKRRAAARHLLSSPE
jgi:hypothetical protein